MDQSESFNNQSQENENSSSRSIWKTITEDDIKEIQELGKGFKNCPQCKAPIDKNGGSNHMTCPVCHHQFCWMCGKDWSLHKNYANCTFYKENEDPYLQNS